MARITLLLTLALATACVPKGKYEASLAEQDELHQRMDALQARMAQQIADLEGQLASNQAALEETKLKLTSKIAEAGQLHADVAQMQLALQELEERKARAEAAMASYRDLVGRFKAMIDAGTLKVKVIDGRMVVELATDILFPAGSASLSKEGTAALQEVATVLASIPDREFQVAGHTDDVPIHTERFPSNWHLGAARAIAVTSLLVDAGLSSERVSAGSYAEHRPIDTNRTKEGKAANRRIEIIVVPDLSTLPGYEELRQMAEGPS